MAANIVHNRLKNLLIALLLPVSVLAQQSSGEAHRPQIHFSPKKGWMNDPNGMVYHNGTYHLFFQHNPDSTVWGPMHWGHATSRDMIHWQEQKIALYPDTLGTIFSGSAVIDVNNTAGFGKNSMVAIYTNHSHELEKTGSDKFQTQSIAYSLDDGKTWTKYAGNPVVKNPGIRDFRDPKVMWSEAEKKWIMTLATLDHITFYSSPDLKSWKEESKFGKTIGAHGGVWECPDLLPFYHNGKKVWVLIVNINPGGPNGGSAGQYFVGDFDGKTFTPFDTEERWLDYGTDNYAAVTFSNTGKRTILLGWMNNWQYAQVVPTKNWRSAMTLSRELSIGQVKGKYYLASTPVKELAAILEKTKSRSVASVKGSYTISTKTNLFQLKLAELPAVDFTITLSNNKNEELVIGFDKKSNEYYIDRSKSGITDFEKGFAKKHVAPRVAVGKITNLTLIADVASVEFFADNGLTVMTDIFFPTTPMTKITVQSAGQEAIKGLNYTPVKPAIK